MINALFGWFEARVTSFPAEAPEQPPARFWAFVRHYAWPFRKLIAWTVVLGTLTALAEVSLFGFLGSIVDWLATANRETFWADHGLKLTLMSLLVLVFLPTIKLIDESLMHQGLLGNFAMRIRWQAHRYLLRQSLDFFQNDYAGRIAAKMMQTALGVRDVVMKFAEILTYVTVYFWPLTSGSARRSLRGLSAMAVCFISSCRRWLNYLKRRPTCAHSSRVALWTATPIFPR